MYNFFAKQARSALSHAQSRIEVYSIGALRSRLAPYMLSQVHLFFFVVNVNVNIFWPIESLGSHAQSRIEVYYIGKIKRLTNNFQHWRLSSKRGLTGQLSRRKLAIRQFWSYRADGDGSVTYIKYCQDRSVPEPEWTALTRFCHPIHSSFYACLPLFLHFPQPIFSNSILIALILPTRRQFCIFLRFLYICLLYRRR